MSKKIPDAVTLRFQAAIKMLLSGGKIHFQSELIKPLKWKQSSLNHVLKGKRNVPLEKAMMLCDAFGIDKEWMWSGKGNPNIKT